MGGGSGEGGGGMEAADGGDDAPAWERCPAPVFAAASCGYCARDAPRKLRCCEATYFCDAECAKQAWLFSHRKHCPREAPVE